MNAKARAKEGSKPHTQGRRAGHALPMIREAMAFHYMDDLDSKLAAVRAALALDTGEPGWSVYSGALGRKFLRLDQFLKSTSATAEENANPKLFQSALFVIISQGAA